MIPELRLEIDALVSSFRFESAALEELVRGPVMNDLIRRGIRVEAAAKRNATGRPGPNVITERLRGSITWRAGNDALSPYVDVGTAVHYAPFVEFGHGNTPHAYPIFTPGGTFTGSFGYVSDKRTPAYPFLGPAAYAAHTT